MGNKNTAQKKFKNQRLDKEVFFYNWIIHHPQVFPSPIFNCCLKINIDGHTRPQIVPKLVLQFFIREIHNSLVSDPEDGGLKKARYAEKI